MGEKDKLSSADKTKIRVMHKHGVSLRAIADEFNVTPPAIFYVLRKMREKA